MASPQDVLRYNQQGIADAIAGLGEVFLGNPQMDAQMAQGQAQTALRDKRLTEAELARQEAQRGVTNQNRAERVFHQLAATDPNAPDFQENLAGNIARLASTGLYDDPEKYGAVARMFTNMGGGDINQIARGETDLSNLIDLEELRDTRGQRQKVADIFGPEVAAAMGGDMPDFMKRAAAISGVQGEPFERALMHTTGQFENVSFPEFGEIHRVSPFGGRETVLDPRQVAAENQRQAGALPSGDTAAGAFAGPGPAETPQAQSPVAGQFGQDGAGAQIPPEQIQPAPENVQAEYGEVPVGMVQTPMGNMEQLFTPDGEPMALFDVLEHTSGLGAGTQRFLTGSLGQFIESLNFPLTAVGKQTQTSLAADIRPLLTVSNRPSRWELQNIQDALVRGEAWENPESASVVLANLYQDIRQGAEEAEEKLRTQRMPRTQRQELRDSIGHSRALLRKIGEPKRISGPEANIRRFQEIGSGLKEAGSDFFQFGSRAADALQGSPSTAEPETPDYSNLSDEELRRRLQGGG